MSDQRSEPPATPKSPFLIALAAFEGRWNAFPAKAEFALWEPYMYPEDRETSIGLGRPGSNYASVVTITLDSPDGPPALSSAASQEPITIEQAASMWRLSTTHARVTIVAATAALAASREAITNAPELRSPIPPESVAIGDNSMPRFLPRTSRQEPLGIPGHSTGEAFPASKRQVPPFGR